MRVSYLDFTSIDAPCSSCPACENNKVKYCEALMDEITTLSSCLPSIIKARASAAAKLAAAATSYICSANQSQAGTLWTQRLNLNKLQLEDDKKAAKH